MDTLKKNFKGLWGGGGGFMKIKTRIYNLNI